MIIIVVTQISKAVYKNLISPHFCVALNFHLHSDYEVIIYQWEINVSRTLRNFQLSDVKHLSF